MNDLSLVQTAELVNELQKRFDVFAVVGRKYTNMNGEFVDIRRINGNNMMVSGLLNTLSIIIANQDLAMTVPIKDNEDR